MSPPPKVAIIGGGPAGCTLARLLVRASIPVDVFEGEASASVRAQGGTLDLHRDSGLKALRECGLYDEFAKYARYDGEALLVTDKKLKAYIKLGRGTERSSRGRPEIDRARLRQILVESLPTEVLHWNCRLRSIDPDLTLHFDHGVEKGFDFIVGADGAWSKVRPLLTDVRPRYAGVGGFDLFVEKAEERYPHLYELVNRGSIFACSDGKGITAQQRGDGSIILYTYSTRAEEWKKTCGYDIHDAGAVKKALRLDYEDWAEPLVELTQVADEHNFIARSLYTLPRGHRWEHHPKMTLIGDAAHLMTPFAGEGVNVAMQDAIDLAHTIIKCSRSQGILKGLDACVKAFEQAMFARAAPVQEHSNHNMELMYFTPGAPHTTIDQWVRNALGRGWLIKIFLPLWLVRLVLRLYFRW